MPGLLFYAMRKSEDVLKMLYVNGVNRRHAKACQRDSTKVFKVTTDLQAYFARFRSAPSLFGLSLLKLKLIIKDEIARDTNIAKYATKYTT